MNYTRNDDGFSPDDKKGDVVIEKGVLDTSANALLLESYIERNNEKVSRTLTQFVMLPDGTFLVQTLVKTFFQVDRSIEEIGFAYFMVFDKNKLEVIKATFLPDVNFTYESIIGKGNISSEEMAQCYEKVRKLTVADGVASAEVF